MAAALLCGLSSSNAPRRARLRRSLPSTPCDGSAWNGTVKPPRRRHREEAQREILRQLLDRGAAYRCYAADADAQAHYRQTPNAPFRSPWRDRDAPGGAQALVRLRLPDDGETILDDAALGRRVERNIALEDPIIGRSDGGPSSVLASVVDDHTDSVTHVLRSARRRALAVYELCVYRALGWAPPIYAHTPPIVEPTLGMMWKADTLASIQSLRDWGCPPAVARAILFQLNLRNGEPPIMDNAEMMARLDLGGLRKGPAKFDRDALRAFSARHLRTAPDAALRADYGAYRVGRTLQPPSDVEWNRMEKTLPALRRRLATLADLDHALGFAYERTAAEHRRDALPALDHLRRTEHLSWLEALPAAFARLDRWTEVEINTALQIFRAAHALSRDALHPPLRAALGAASDIVPITLTIAALGREETLDRLRAVLLR